MFCDTVYNFLLILMYNKIDEISTIGDDLKHTFVQRSFISLDGLKECEISDRIIYVLER
jgi:hypothetical protein